MDKQLSEFLRDTSIFVDQADACTDNNQIQETQDALVSMSHSLMHIASQILELEQGDVVSIHVDQPSTFTIKLGALGTYHIDGGPECLNKVANRLQTIALSPRFIKAILGQWPA